VMRPDRASVMQEAGSGSQSPQRHRSDFVCGSIALSYAVSRPYVMQQEISIGMELVFARVQGIHVTGHTPDLVEDSFATSDTGCNRTTRRCLESPHKLRVEVNIL